MGNQNDFDRYWNLEFKDKAEEEEWVRCREFIYALREARVEQRTSAEQIKGYIYGKTTGPKSVNLQYTELKNAISDIRESLSKFLKAEAEMAKAEMTEAEMTEAERIKAEEAEAEKITSEPPLPSYHNTRSTKSI
ncbi:hypothetical protein ABW20_dc0101360 [Dactylellina cionopaga]|nr:hypothetical protein ABW20_dc0101360 [Dactylellina cionopaga]